MRVIVVMAALLAALGQAVATEDYFDRSRRLGEQINENMVRSSERREAEIQRAETERRLRELERQQEQARRRY